MCVVHFCILSIYFQPNCCKHEFIARTVSRLQHRTFQDSDWFSCWAPRSIKPNPLTAHPESVSSVFVKWHRFQASAISTDDKPEEEVFEPGRVSDAYWHVAWQVFNATNCCQTALHRKKQVNTVAWRLSTDTLFNQVFGSVRGTKQKIIINLVLIRMGCMIMVLTCHLCVSCKDSPAKGRVGDSISRFGCKLCQRYGNFAGISLILNSYLNKCKECRTWTNLLYLACPKFSILKFKNSSHLRICCKDSVVRFWQWLTNGVPLWECKNHCRSIMFNLLFVFLIMHI